LAFVFLFCRWRRLGAMAEGDLQTQKPLVSPGQRELLAGKKMRGKK
jgi:hypothetical protein